MMARKQRLDDRGEEDHVMNRSPDRSLSSEHHAYHFAFFDSLETAPAYAGQVVRVKLGARLAPHELHTRSARARLGRVAR